MKDKNKLFKSCAQWPFTLEVGSEDHITKDLHYTRKEAECICSLLEKEGFGGEGKIFPIKTWIEES